LALKHSLEKYITIIYKDDVITNTRFEKQINYLENNDIRVIAIQMVSTLFYDYYFL